MSNSTSEHQEEEEESLFIAKGGGRLFKDSNNAVNEDLERDRAERVPL